MDKCHIDNTNQMLRKVSIIPNPIICKINVLHETEQRRKSAPCRRTFHAGLRLLQGQAMKLSAGFGGGIGRMRMTCGAACGMVTLAGMDCGSVTAGDREGKSVNYRVVQQLMKRFEEMHGSTVCAELLKLKQGAPLSYEASERTAEYYKTRPCVSQIVSAAKIFAEYLEDTEGPSLPPQGEV